MKSGFLITILIFSLLRSFAAAGETLPKLNIVTESWRPYQYTEMGQLKGLSVDLLEKMLERSGSSQNREDFMVLPWIRAYKIALNTPNTILFSVTRTPEREALFKWVGPIFENATYLIAHKRSNIRVTDARQLRSYNFGTIREDASEIFLKRIGVDQSQFTRNAKTVSNLVMLEAGRIDMVVCSWDSLVQDAGLVGLNPDDFEIVHKIDSSDVSYALHIRTPDSIVNTLQNALDVLKKDGTFQQIWKKHRGVNSNPLAPNS